MHFQKKLKKTPKREIDQAIREVKDLRERGLNDE
jgi:phage-related protein